MKNRHLSILERFEQISRIPRCSKNEGQIRDWLIQWAEEIGFEYRQDDAGNLVVRVPPSPGFENAPTVVFQGHMDMVCEKTPDSDHDFSRDPIRLVYEGEWLTADRTTLGADNGIAMALFMALSEDEAARRPPLELLFTVDEETGLTGANRLDPSLIEGRMLLNLDSEDEGVFTIGCAGGEELLIDAGIERTDTPAGLTALSVRVEGLRGGHSGVDIGKHRENANRLLIRILEQALAVDGIRLLELNGGSGHNVIPRNSEACLLCTEAAVSSLHGIVEQCRHVFSDESDAYEPGLEVAVTPFNGDPPVAGPIAPESARRLLDLLQSLPHGVYRMSAAIDGLVETSNNLAMVRTENDTVRITTSQRSSILSRLDELNSRIRAVAALYGARVESMNRYPAWQPDVNSRLLARSKKVYKKLFSADPVVEIIHAGLECGIIGSKIAGMEMISFGPTIRNAHSPNECLHTPSVAKIYDFLTELLAALATC